ncbi:4019_t:CDS:2 [Acaulospora colombiana]|uniref:4019_t:CDS:1 n=1 Tax=Acaulospora colombiana TaxID=27376 RepID=A0ACA9JX30_9GLOM|nr:4019_t:CDS:2 [Acaulospora colombiana]
MSNHPATPPPNRQPSTYATGQQLPVQGEAPRNPPVQMQTGQYQQRQSQFAGGFSIPRPQFQPPVANAGQGQPYHNNPNPNPPILPAINTQYNHRASMMMSPATYSTPFQPHPPYGQNNPYCNMPQSILSPTDLLRKFYGTCHGCGQPNTDFAECQSCKQWLVHMESLINARKTLVQRQFCDLCKLPKHVHHQIAACGKCGFPRSNMEELSKVAIKKELSDSIFEDLKLKEQLGFVCTNCNQSLEGFLKCPTYGEVATRMRKERELVQFEDPNFQKLSNIVKEYAEKERNSKPLVQKSTKPNLTTKDSGDKVNELANMTKELHIGSKNVQPVSNNPNAYPPNNQGNYEYGKYPNQNNQSNYGGPLNSYSSK